MANCDIVALFGETDIITIRQRNLHDSRSPADSFVRSVIDQVRVTFFSAYMNEDHEVETLHSLWPLTRFHYRIDRFFLLENYFASTIVRTISLFQNRIDKYLHLYKTRIFRLERGENSYLSSPRDIFT